MNPLSDAVARVQASINAAITKIDVLKASQVDPAALNTATTSLNTAADLLDSKVNS